MRNTRFHTINVVDETGSTNADLLAKAGAGLEEGHVLIARHQTLGRGRQGRTWLDEPDASLLMSASIRPTPAAAPLIPLVTGTAVVLALKDLYGLTVGLKWPNDVISSLPGHRKLAGILAEAVTVGTQITVIVGLGMNLSFAGPLPEEVAGRAVDLATLLRAGLLGADEANLEGTNQLIDRQALVAAMLGRLDLGLTKLESGGALACLAAYRPHCITLGRNVRFTTSVGEIIGRAVDLDSAGGLVIQEPTGQRTTVTAGDAHHL